MAADNLHKFEGNDSMDSNELVTRLAALERQARTTRWALSATLCALVALIAGVAVGAMKTEPSLDSQELVIHDKGGSERIKMGVDETGPFLRLFDSKGRPRAVLMVQDDGSLLSLPGGPTFKSNLMITNRAEPAMYMSDNDGKIRAELSSRNGTVRMILTDPNQKEALVLAGAPEGPSFSMFDDQKKLRAVMSVFQGVSRFSLLDPKQVQRALMLAAADAATVAVNDENENRRASMIDATGSGGVFGRTGTPMWTSPASADVPPGQVTAPAAPSR